MRTHYWCEKYQDYLTRNRCITSDRVPPKWFLEELAKLDQCLRVEWWNHPPGYGMEPTFRMVRVEENGKWGHVMWFQMASYAILHHLRRSSSVRQNKVPHDIYLEELAETKREIEEEEAYRAEQWRVKGEDFIDACYRYKPNRLFSYRK